MSKFKVGDQIVGTAAATAKYGITQAGWRGRVTRVAKDYFKAIRANGKGGEFTLDYIYFDLIDEGGAPMARKTYKLLKDLPDIRKGALFQEACDDGDQEYKMITTDYFKYPESRRSVGIEDDDCNLDRDSVEKEPTWFVEVFPVTPPYLTQAELDQWEAFKAQKPAKRTVAKKVGRPAKKAA
jgi:hypothetical protein